MMTFAKTRRVKTLWIAAALLIVLPGTHALADTACATLEASGFGSKKSAESDPSTGTARNPLGSCPNGSVRLQRVNNNGQKVTKCASVENCGTATKNLETRLCTEFDKDGFPTYSCVTKQR